MGRPEDTPIIAIVDDDESVCRAIQRLVRSMGMHTSSFLSGDDFLSFVEGVRSFEPDCVILDVQMRGTNGLTVQDRLRQRPSPPPVIFITAHDAPGVRERALAGGAVAFLRKPFSDDVLMKTLETALRRRESDC